MPMLILFDIDGTLLLTRGAGVHAMQDAGRELFGDHFTFEGVEFSGRLDPLIWRDLAARNGVDDPDEHHAPFRAAYARYLTSRLEAQPTAHALPGVAELLDAILLHEHITIGLLTGNYPETGVLKLRAAGLDPDCFALAAWGIDGPTRRDLPPHARREYLRIRRREIPAEQVVIIGDTPHDVDCARHNGCRVIGVATGAFSAAQLRDTGADHVAENLAETEALLAWLLKQSPASAQEQSV